MTLCINSDFFYKITANDKDGTLDGEKAIYSDFYDKVYWEYHRYSNRTVPLSNYLDRIILQSLAEVAIKSNVSYAYYLPDEITSGLCEIVGGFDNGNIEDLTGFIESTGNHHNNQAYGYGLLRYLAKNYSDGVSYNAKKTTLTVTTDFEDKTLDLADFESTVKNVKASALKKGIKIIGNKLNNSIVGGSGNDSIYGGAGADTLSGGSGNDKLFGEAGNDSILGGDGDDTLSGGSGNDKLLGEAGNVSLLGGAGKDTLNGGAGNDTLTGGKGFDVFIYTAGNDVITDYAEGDKISISGTIANAELNDSDVVFTIGKNTLTVKKGKDKTLTIIDSAGKEYETVVSGATTLNITNDTPSPVTLDADVETADASKRTKAIKITGNKLDNVIIGGSGKDSLYGGSGNDSLSGGSGKDTLSGGASNDYLSGGTGNDTLWGGKADDYLYGGDGEDVFLYKPGEGKDRIYDYNPAFDTIKLLSGTVDNVESAGTDIVFTIGTGKIILDNAAGNSAEIVDASGTTLKKYTPRTRS